jgi:hypothetical protein
MRGGKTNCRGMACQGNNGPEGNRLNPETNGYEDYGGRVISGAGSGDGAAGDVALLPGVGDGTGGATGGDRGFHVQFGGGKAAGLDVAATGESAGLGVGYSGIAALGSWWRESIARAGGPA